jgi:hypothetical protein
MIPVTPLDISETAVRGSDMTVKSAALKSAALKSAMEPTVPSATVPSASARMNEIWLAEDHHTQQRGCYAHNEPCLFGGGLVIARLSHRPTPIASSCGTAILIQSALPFPSRIYVRDGSRAYFQ